MVEAALEGGLTLVQYRDKNTDDAERLRNVERLRQICHHYGALFIMNDRGNLAFGVHLGQQDMLTAFARELLGPQRLIGPSTTNPEEMQRAIAEGADYMGVGPVYETPTKPGKTPAGLAYVRYASEHSSIPGFAIGGIEMHNLTDVLDCGAERVAVVGGNLDAARRSRGNCDDCWWRLRVQWKSPLLGKWYANPPQSFRFNYRLEIP